MNNENESLFGDNFRGGTFGSRGVQPSLWKFDFQI
jgi:hypothetical protein